MKKETETIERSTWNIYSFFHLYLKIDFSSRKARKETERSFGRNSCFSCLETKFSSLLFFFHCFSLLPSHPLLDVASFTTLHAPVYWNENAIDTSSNDVISLRHSERSSMTSLGCHGMKESGRGDYGLNKVFPVPPFFPSFHWHLFASHSPSVYRFPIYPDLNETRWFLVFSWFHKFQAVKKAGMKWMGKLWRRHGRQ